MALAASEVVIRQSGKNVTFQIANVQKVEKTTHRIRNLMITFSAIGFAGGFLLSCGGGDEGDCWPEIGALFGGIGAGAGALVGWSINHRAARDGRDVLFPSRSSATRLVAPLVSPHRAGVGMLVRW